MKIKEELRTPMKILRKAWLPGCFMLAALSMNAATTVSWTFDTGVATCPVATTENCNGEAVISYMTGSNTFTVSLTDLLSPIQDAGQLVTDFDFTTTLGASLTSSSGLAFNIESNGTPDAATAVSSTGWNVAKTGNNYILCVICPTGTTSSGPAMGIITNQTTYASANNSITNFGGPHQPFLESGATFTFTTTTALPTSTTVNPFSNVAISFGTGFGAGLPTTTSGGGGPQGGPVPEPLTPVLAGAGLIALGLLRRKKA